MRKLYKYNPSTDNFERFYPNLKDRLRQLAIVGGLSLAIGTGLFLIAYFGFADPSERNLRHENAMLESHLKVLDKRVESAMKVMEQIRNRDDNFYRVIMHADPLLLSQRYAGLDNEERYREIGKIPDNELLDRLTRRMDLLDRQIYAQSQSFDELRDLARGRHKRMESIPAIFPIKQDQFTVSSGFGDRVDPIFGNSKLHPGFDLAASTGTEVFATADGIVEQASRRAEYGNCIIIAHGNNYDTIYAHLDDFEVKAGDKVSRGQLIGHVGNTGKSTAPHLHYEVRFKDVSQNPVNYLFMDLNPDSYAKMLQTSEDAGNVMD